MCEGGRGEGGREGGGVPYGVGGLPRWKVVTYGRSFSYPNVKSADIPPLRPWGYQRGHQLMIHVSTP